MLRFGKRPRRKSAVPDGLFVKCDGCGAMVYRKNVEEALYTCPECNYHFRITALDRIRLRDEHPSYVLAATGLMATPAAHPLWDDRMMAQPLGALDLLVIEA